MTIAESIVDKITTSAMIVSAANIDKATSERNPR
jgi:hypothetical protein